MSINVTLQNAVVDAVLPKVDSQISLINGWGNSAMSAAAGAISSLGSIGVGGAVPPPKPPTLATVPSINGTISLGAAPKARLIQYNKPEAPETGGEYEYEPGEAPTYTPSVAGIYIPEAPGDIDYSGLPTAPDLSEVLLPDAPLYDQPVMDAMEPITIPSFVFPTLPVFDATAPEFTGSAPSTVVSWNEPEYASENLSELKAQVGRMLRGGTGLPAEVEQAIFDRARGREDQITAKVVSEAFDTFASRGFDMPPGMLAAQVNAALQDGALRASALSRETMVKAAEWEIENIRFAVQQGIAYENLMVNLFNNVAQRAFEIAKLRVESDLQLYNAQVNVFNAMSQAYQVRASVYKTELDGELSKVEVYKAELEGQKIIGELNQQKVQIFLAEYEAVKARVEAYKAMMSGAQIQSELNKTKIEGYKAGIDAYAAKLGAEKVKFDAYEARVKGEAAKAGIIDAEARAFASEVQAYASGEQVKTRAIELKIEAMKADIARFAAESEGEKARVQAEGMAAEAEARVFATKSTGEVESARVRGEISRMNISIAELNAQNHMHKYSAEAKAYDAQLTQSIQQAKVAADALAAAANAAAHMASGAMSAARVNVSAQASGTSMSGFQYSQSV